MPYKAAQHRAQQLHMLKQSSGAQALKDQKDRLDEVVLSIRAELAAVELDAKAPKQLKERTKTLLEKAAKLKLKVRKSPSICNLTPVCLLWTAQHHGKSSCLTRKCTAPQRDCHGGIMGQETLKSVVLPGQNNAQRRKMP